jgi:hypothetical protein
MDCDAAKAITARSAVVSAYANRPAESGCGSLRPASLILVKLGPEISRAGSLAAEDSSVKAFSFQLG